VDVAEPDRIGQLLQGKSADGQNETVGKSWVTQQIDLIGCPLGALPVGLATGAPVRVFI